MIDGVIFDKDGTLFDFRSSWGAWTETMLGELATNPDTARRLGLVLGYDLATRQFLPGSPVVAMTTPEIADVLHPHLTGIGIDELNDRMNRQAVLAPMRPAVDLPAVLGALKARGLRLGLATNDTEMPARRHLSDAGVIDLFDFVAGCDSGYGGKPAAGQLQAFAHAMGLRPSRVAMVGDSRHDLDAGLAAGMWRVAVLTGIAEAAELAPHADVVLPDISTLLAWIDSKTRAHPRS